MLKTIVLCTVLPSYLTGIMALGCKVFLNSKKLFFNMIICRITLTPPLVDPAEPPVKNKAKKIPVAKKLHMVKSAETNPVVVMIEVTINKACLMALSVSPNTFGCARTLSKFGS